MIDDNGVARLAGGRNLIVVEPNTPAAGQVQSGGDLDSYRYLAPELHQPEGGTVDETLITKENDVYGVGMVIFEVSSSCSVRSGVTVESHVNLLGLDRGQAVLRVQRYGRIVKGTGWGVSSTVLSQDPW